MNGIIRITNYVYRKDAENYLNEHGWKLKSIDGLYENNKYPFFAKIERNKFYQLIFFI